MVPRRGLEPPCRKAHAPKACVSTISPPRLIQERLYPFKYDLLINLCIYHFTCPQCLRTSVAGGPPRLIQERLYPFKYDLLINLCIYHFTCPQCLRTSVAGGPPRLLSGDYNSIGRADTGTSAFLILFMKNLVCIIQPSVETVL